MGDLFTTRFVDCHFYETEFPSLVVPKTSKDEKHKKVNIFSWNEKNLFHLDRRTPECENEIRCIVHLKAITNKLLDKFIYATKVAKSHIPAMNAPTRIIDPK